jgi:hypothetical protein
MIERMSKRQRILASVVIVIGVVGVGFASDLAGVRSNIGRGLVATLAVAMMGPLGALWKRPKS